MVEGPESSAPDVRCYPFRLQCHAFNAFCVALGESHEPAGTLKRVSDGVLDVVVICRRSATKNALLKSRDYSIVLAGESIKKGPKESER